MARMEGADPKRMGFGAGIFTRFAYWATKRKVGKLVAPVQITAHQPRILWAMSQMEQRQAAAKKLDQRIKYLAELRTATLVGCPF